MVPMKIALIDCTYDVEGRPLKLRTVGYFPATLAVLAAALPDGHDVTLIHEKCEDVDTSAPYDVVFFTTMGPNLYRAIEHSKAFRARGVKTIVGGWMTMPHPELCREHFDSMVTGDAEGILGTILDDLARGALAPLYENPNPDLSGVRVPRYELIRRDIVGGVVPLEASRGCTNACDFCAVSAFMGRRFRPIPIETVLAAIAHAKATLKRPLYYFTDPNFALDRKRALELVRRMEPLGITWQANVDIRTLADEEFLREAKAAGCFTLQVGLETPDKGELVNINKGFAANRDYAAIIKRAHELGIPVTGLMMVGYDSDTPETFERLERFIQDNNVSVFVVHVLTPVRGTRLYDRLKAEGRLLEEPGARADGLRLHVRPLHMTPEAFEARYRVMIQKLTSLGAILRRCLHADFFKNFKANVIMLLTNLALRRYLRLGYPPGMFE